MRLPSIPLQKYNVTVQSQAGLEEHFCAWMAMNSLYYKKGEETLIKAVFFDIDNTLYDYDDMHRLAMQHIVTYAEKRWKLSEQTVRQGVQKAMDDLTVSLGVDNASSHNRLIRFARFLEQQGIYDYVGAVEMAEMYWNSFFAHMQPEKGLLQFMDQLKSSGIRIGIGTNMTAYVQYLKLRALGVLPYADILVTSEDAGAEKPNPAFFACCLHRAGVRPEECIFIGDSQKHDIEGALHAGMHAVWYSRGQGIEKNTANVPAIADYDGAWKLLKLQSAV